MEQIELRWGDSRVGALDLGGWGMTEPMEAAFLFGSIALAPGDQECLVLGFAVEGPPGGVSIDLSRPCLWRAARAALEEPSAVAGRARRVVLEGGRARGLLEWGDGRFPLRGELALSGEGARGTLRWAEGQGTGALEWTEAWLVFRERTHLELHVPYKTEHGWSACSLRLDGAPHLGEARLAGRIEQERSAFELAGTVHGELLRVEMGRLEVERGWRIVGRPESWSRVVSEVSEAVLGSRWSAPGGFEIRPLDIVVHRGELRPWSVDGAIGKGERAMAERSAAERDTDPESAPRRMPAAASREEKPVSPTPSGSAFCPNCGWQNATTASTCMMCGFSLKGAAAPKFKGTMLMSDDFGATAAPSAERAPSEALLNLGLSGPPNQGLVGTVVGVAPPGLGPSGGAAPGVLPPHPPPPPPPFGGGPFVAPPFGGDPFGGQTGSPPLPSVVPLGAPGELPPPPGGFGGPPGGGYGGAPPQEQGYGARVGGGWGANPDMVRELGLPLSAPVAGAGPPSDAMPAFERMAPRAAEKGPALGERAASAVKAAAAAVGEATSRRGPSVDRSAPAAPLERGALLGPPPMATAYRPSWIAPKRQSSLYIYVFVPEAKRAIDEEAHAALDAPGNRARGAHAVPLFRALRPGELIVADVELEGFKLGRGEPMPWSPPYARFVIPILAPEDAVSGAHRPIVSIRAYRADGPGELLARLDFDLEVRSSTGGRPLARVSLMSGGVSVAFALATAVGLHALPPLVGLPTGAACLAGGVGAWVALRPALGRAVLRDVSRVFVSYAREDLDRVRQAASLLRAAGLLPWIDVDQLRGGDQWGDRLTEAIDQADRFFLFWSHHARESHWVTEEWKRALARARRVATFIVPVMLDADRPESDHPLSRFQYVFLDGQGAPMPVPAPRLAGA